MTDLLVLCPSCDRHVRASERACPFCACALPASLGATAIGVPTQRLHRAALMAFGVSLALGGAACQRSSGGGSGSTESIVQPYGAPPNPPVPPQPQPADADTTAIVQPYGAPPNPQPDPLDPQQPQAGADAGTSHAADAGRRRGARDGGTVRRPPDDRGAVRALYGDAPPPGSNRE